jgi:hypothetical protein
MAGARSKRKSAAGARDEKAVASVLVPAAVLDRRVVPVVFAAALVVRLAYVLFARGPAFVDPLVDADYYDYLGERIAHGSGFDPGPFWQPPLYPLLLGVIYRIAGHTLVAPRVVQASMGAFTAAAAAVLAFRATRASRAAWIAGLAVALHGVLVFYDGELLATTLSIALCSAALLFATRDDSPTARDAIGSGGLLGLATLAVAPIGLVAPALAVAWWRRRRRASVVLVAAFAVPLLLCATVNRARSGEWVMVSANGGVNLWIGNNPDGERALAIRPGAGWQALMDEPSAAGARTAAEQDRWFRDRALSFCATSPIRCGAGLLRKAWLLVASREAPRNEDIYVLRFQSPVIAALVWRIGSIGFPGVIVFPLAALGVYVALRRREAIGDATRVPSSTLAAAFFALCIGPVIFFVTARHRAPMIPLACVFASIGVVTWPRLARTDPARTFALGVAGVVLAFAAWPTRYATDDVPFAAEMFFEIGGRRERRGDVDGAMHAWEQALSRRPDYREAAVNLALLHARRGETSEAMRLLDSMVQLYPDDPLIRAQRDIVAGRH